MTSDWLDGYLRAWRTKDAADVRAIFTDDAEYWFHPYDREPVHGIDAIVEAWMGPEPTQAVWDLAVLVEGEGIGIIRGRSTIRATPRTSTCGKSISQRTVEPRNSSSGTSRSRRTPIPALRTRDSVA